MLQPHILEFGIGPTIPLRDADGSTPLHVAVQKEDPVHAELLLKYGPTQLLYTENSIGQTPLDVASLKGLPRVIYPEQFLRSPKATPVFHVDKQKIEIPKLRATIDTLLANGNIAHGSKLTTELLAFVDRMERRLSEETAREHAALSLEEKGELDTPTPHDAATRMYFALRDAAAARRVEGAESVNSEDLRS
ncbi:hypothetical protein EI94DRAFT_1702591 [Lactarius quietus]|nr:hypothetical protein EI94DRAFT_1702591 [Lactarius quietus]